MNSDSTVYIVDDDEAVRHSLGLLIHSVGLVTKSFASALAFLDAGRVESEDAQPLQEPAEHAVDEESGSSCPGYVHRC